MTTLTTHPIQADPLPTMQVIGAPLVKERIEVDRPAVVETVKGAYLAHHRGLTNNPHSSFLRFPNQPRNRIIALPAHLEDDAPVSGIKWIASYPENPARGIPRASAVLVLNDESTGYADTIMEASVISSARTAASGVLAAEVLTGQRTARRVAVIGAGLIARQVLDFLHDLDWQVEQFVVHDLNPDHATTLARRIQGSFHDATATTASTAADAIRDSDLVIITTVAATPHIHDAALFEHHPVVLHLSLRDLGPEVIESAENFTDDVDHAVRERTSLELAAIRHRDHAGQVPNDQLPFIAGTIGHLLEGSRTRTPGKTAIFSPFGLGVLDLAVARWVTRSLPAAGTLVPGFYDTLTEG